MVHCNPAPPHPPPGEIYNAICIGQPYIDGFPIGYAVFGSMIVFALLSLLVFRMGERPKSTGKAADE